MFSGSSQTSAHSGFVNTQPGLRPVHRCPVAYTEVVHVQRVGWLVMILAAPLLGGTGVHNVDFRNFQYQRNTPTLGVPTGWRWLGLTPSSTVRVVDGRHDFSSSDALAGRYARGYLIVHKVTYGDLDGDGLDEAAVDLLFSTGGTANWRYLYVFTMKNGAPTLLGILRSGSRADGGLVNVAIEKKTLVLDFADSGRRVADCCSEGYVRVRYHRDAGRFIETGIRQSGDLSLGGR